MFDIANARARILVDLDFTLRTHPRGVEAMPRVRERSRAVPNVHLGSRHTPRRHSRAGLTRRRRRRLRQTERNAYDDECRRNTLFSRHWLNPHDELAGLYQQKKFTYVYLHGDHADDALRGVVHGEEDHEDELHDQVERAALNDDVDCLTACSFGEVHAAQVVHLVRREHPDAPGDEARHHHVRA